MNKDLKVVRQDFEALDKDLTRLANESSLTLSQIKNLNDLESEKGKEIEGKEKIWDEFQCWNVQNNK